jgi:hypothetical protein
MFTATCRTLKDEKDFGQRRRIRENDALDALDSIRFC